MFGGSREGLVMAALAVVFAVLAVAFALDMGDKPAPLPPIPPVDPHFLETATWRKSYADLVRAEEDIDHFDCYLCHEEGKKQELTFDKNGVLVIPEEHEDSVMGHGTHGRNNLCFNCHNEENLTLLKARQGEELKMEDSTRLCGSCHGPSLRDWNSGSHGRISGYWDRSRGEFKKLDCVNCHDPHSPSFPSRAPAPGPNYLRPMGHKPAPDATSDH
jgi:hypothetical protein